MHVRKDETEIDKRGPETRGIFTSNITPSLLFFSPAMTGKNKSQVVLESKEGE